MEFNRKVNLYKLQSKPALASVHWDPVDDTQNDIVQWFETFYALAYEIRIGLGCAEVSEAIEELANKYGVRDYQKIGEISRLVREVFARNIREDEIRKRMTERLELNEYDADHMLVDFKHIIQLVKLAGEQEIIKTTEFLPIMEAMRKYPDIAYLEIGTGSILRESEEEFIEPNIRNWLEDYFSHVGTGRHDSLVRSDYLFNSKNAKSLDSTDREKLAIILKAYDTDSPLMIDWESGEIIFSAMSENLKKPDVLPQIENSVEKQGLDIDVANREFQKKWHEEGTLDDKVEEFFSVPRQKIEEKNLPPDVRSMSFEPGPTFSSQPASSWDRQKEELDDQKAKFQNIDNFPNQSWRLPAFGADPNLKSGSKFIGSDFRPKPVQKPKTFFQAGSNNVTKRSEVVQLEERPPKRPERNVVDLNEYI